MIEFSKKYFNYLTNELASINLTAIRDFDDFHNKQIIDSVAPFEQSIEFKELISKARVVVDIGFGGGFPLLPLAHIVPHGTFLGFESRNKKVKVVAELAEHLDIKNVKTYHHRVEEIDFDIESIVTLKAVGPVDRMLPLINPSVETKVLFYKAKNFFEDEKAAIKKVEKNWEIFMNEEIQVPGTDQRIIIGFKNKNVPRRTNNKLVKLSSFL